jgi:hypothetical protein
LTQYFTDLRNQVGKKVRDCLIVTLEWLQHWFVKVIHHSIH